MKTDLELRHLRVLVAVVEAGSHTRAARTLGVSQSTVSETLSALERSAGAILFAKSTKGLVLTSAGDVVLDYARRILSMTGELAAKLADVSANVNATLVVGAVESLSAYVLPQALASLRERWPKARLEVITGSCPEIRERVATGKCDLGLLLEGDTGADGATVISRSRFVVFATSTHPLVGKRANPDELRRCDFYMCDAAGNYHQVIRHYFEAAQVPLPRTQSMGTVEGVKRGIEMGGSPVGFLPLHAVARELEDGSLVELAVDPTLPDLVMRAVFRDQASPMVDELVDRLRSAANAAPVA